MIIGWENEYYLVQKKKDKYIIIRFLYNKYIIKGNKYAISFHGIISNIQAVKIIFYNKDNLKTFNYNRIYLTS